MPQNELNIGDYNLHALGNIDIHSTGPHVKVEATGAKSALSLSGTKAITMQSGPALLAMSNDSATAGAVTLQAGAMGTLKLGVGLPHIGSFLTMEPDALSLSVGPEGLGASIKMTPDSITFKVGEATFTMSPASISEEVLTSSRAVNAQGHNFTAAETELSVGVAGIENAAPMLQSKADAAHSSGATLCDQSVDAALNVDSAMMMVS